MLGILQNFKPHNNNIYILIKKICFTIVIKMSGTKNLKKKKLEDNIKYWSNG